jgi:voltage-gated potassium channel
MSVTRFLVILAATAVLILLGGATAWHFEHGVDGANIKTLEDGYWWAVVTIMTVGYGDRFPVTLPGRGIAVFLMFCGVGVVSILTATIASFLVERQLRERAGMESFELSGHHIICGWNDKVPRLLAGMQSASDAKSLDVVCIHEGSEEKVAGVQSSFTKLRLHFVRGDMTSEPVLKRARVEKAGSITFLVDEHHPGTADERTVIGATLAIDLNPGIHVCAELSTPRNRPLLERLGVHNVLVGGAMDGHLLATAVVSPGVQGAIEEIFGVERSRIHEVEVPQGFRNLPFAELAGHFARNGEILLGLARRRKSLQLDDFLNDGESFVDQFIRRKFQEAERQYFGGKGQVGVFLNPPPTEKIQDDDLAIVLT